jgi:hypothetical protein
MSISVNSGTPRNESDSLDSNRSGYTYWKLDPVRIVSSHALGTVQISFLEPPPAEIRAELKAHGFRWSPKCQAWNRAICEDAKFHALRIALVFKEWAEAE